MRSVIIHGHFYQPPRENPFLEEMEAEPSAAPFHDWNQRIERECYRAVVAARVTGSDGRIRRLVNTLEWISFNFGPTLLEWMEREAKSTYESVLAADRASTARMNGLGNAIAQPYHHSILPLASRRDKQTEVRWGIADFRRRYGRDPVGMWLPETAVDTETLEVLAEEGIAFTIVAPHQVAGRPPGGRPGLVRLGKRSIALCIYDGELSHQVAFGGALDDGVRWARQLDEAASSMALSATHATSTPSVDESDVLVALATDGESYGHHHKFGEMALARALLELQGSGVTLESFASFLARNPATHEVTVVEPTSWSCAHGVGRWMRNCSCRIDGQRYPSQEWRSPLRQGFNTLALELHRIFEGEATSLIPDPWQARDGYGTVVASGPAEQEQYVRSVASGAHTSEELVRARELLEMERDALRMFTSCGWFFDDIGGIETRQDLRYAARAIELAGSAAGSAEQALLRTLETAVSNDPATGTGRDVYERNFRGVIPAPMRQAAAAVAARTVAPGERRHFLSVATQIDDDWVRVVERRTGRRHEFRWSVSRRTANDVRVELISRDGSHRSVALADLPERPRLAIRAVLRKALLPQCLNQGELDQLMSGTTSMGGLLRVALIRAVERLETDEGPAAVRLVSDLIELFEQFEARMPFDAQSAFWRVWEDSSESRRDALRTLYRRLGFAEDATFADGSAG